MYQPLPWPNSYEVPGWSTVAGEYPFHDQRGPGLERLRALLDCGITTVIDLTERWESGLVPYEDELAQLARERGIEVAYHRCAIPDVYVPGSELMQEILQLIEAAVARGSRVYVHCWGGAGRTGVVVGCLLRQRGLSGEEALAKVGELFATMPKSRRPEHRSGSPQTAEQRQFVRDGIAIG